MNSQDATNAADIRKTRAGFEARGLKRAEFWVPGDLTRAEKAIIQGWMEEIAEDARAQHTDQKAKEIE